MLPSGFGFLLLFVIAYAAVTTLAFKAGRTIQPSRAVLETIRLGRWSLGLVTLFPAVYCARRNDELPQALRAWTYFAVAAFGAMLLVLLSPLATLAAGALLGLTMSELVPGILLLVSVLASLSWAFLWHKARKLSTGLSALARQCLMAQAPLVAIGLLGVCYPDPPHWRLAQACVALYAIYWHQVAGVLLVSTVLESETSRRGERDAMQALVLDTALQWSLVGFAALLVAVATLSH